LVGGYEMSKILKPFNKVMGAIGLVDVDDDDEDDDNVEYEETVYGNESSRSNYEPEIIGKKNKIVSIKNNASSKVILKKPIEFQDIMEIVDAVKSRKIVVINMMNVDSKTAQRMIDYIVGACYALNGTFNAVEKCIYVFAPDGVDIANELEHEISKDDFYSFNG
jgi:cell division inhibitor SepF